MYEGTDFKLGIGVYREWNGKIKAKKVAETQDMCFMVMFRILCPKSTT